jgi:hypothetical protein
MAYTLVVGWAGCWIPGRASWCCTGCGSRSCRSSARRCLWFVRPRRAP